MQQQPRLFYFNLKNLKPHLQLPLFPPLLLPFFPFPSFLLLFFSFPTPASFLWQYRFAARVNEEENFLLEVELQVGCRG